MLPNIGRSNIKDWFSALGGSFSVTGVIDAIRVDTGEVDSVAGVYVGSGVIEEVAANEGSITGGFFVGKPATPSTGSMHPFSIH